MREEADQIYQKHCVYLALDQQCGEEPSGGLNISSRTRDLTLETPPQTLLS